MKPRSGPPPAPPKPTTKLPTPKPSTQQSSAPPPPPPPPPPTSTSPSTSGDEPQKARLGLAKKNAPTTTGPKTAEQVARAFEKGDVTLATVLGVTNEQRAALKERAFSRLKDRRADAMPLLEGLVALDPFDVWALAALAGLKMDADQLPLTLTLLDRALQVDPTDVVARALRAEARHKSGDAAGAWQDMTILDDADPTLLPVRRARALVPPKKMAPTSTELLRPPSRAPAAAGAAASPSKKPVPKPLPPTSPLSPSQPKTLTSSKPLPPRR